MFLLEARHLFEICLGHGDNYLLHSLGLSRINLGTAPMSWGCIQLHSPLNLCFSSHNLSGSRSEHFTFSTYLKETFSTSYLMIVEGALAYSTSYLGKIAVGQYNSWGREMKTTLLYCFRRCFNLTLIWPQMICKITLNNNLLESLSLRMYFRHITWHVSVTGVSVLYTQSNANTFYFIL